MIINIDTLFGDFAVIFKVIRSFIDLHNNV